MSILAWNEIPEGLSPELDELGVLSGVAQGLSGPITSTDKLISTATQNPHQRHHLLVFVEDSHALGFIKWGSKDLYFYRKNGSMLQCSPVCLLDFFVRESEQRRGLGLKIFKAMLQHLGNLEPSTLAYDRPSHKLIAFMRKHFGLVKPDLQPNRYCLFEGFPID